MRIKIFSRRGTLTTEMKWLAGDQWHVVSVTFYTRRSVRLLKEIRINSSTVFNGMLRSNAPHEFSYDTRSLIPTVRSSPPFPKRVYHSSLWWGNSVIYVIFACGQGCIDGILPSAACYLQQKNVREEKLFDISISKFA